MKTTMNHHLTNINSRIWALLLICIFTQSLHAFYNPVQGRWRSRDPIEESGGVNLYGFVSNHAIKHYDVLGKGEKNTDADADYKKNVENCGEKVNLQNQNLRNLQSKSLTRTPKCESPCKLITVIIKLPHPCGGSKIEAGNCGHSGTAVGNNYYDFGPASSDPGIDYSRFDNGEYASCESRFGVEWKQVGKFHSHPFQSGSNPSDIDKANKEGGRRFLGWDNGHGVSIATEY